VEPWQTRPSSFLEATQRGDLLPLFPRINASPYLFFSWPFTYSCTKVSIKHVCCCSRPPNNGSQLRPRSLSGKPTSVCSIAMFM
jgi:hypothetical protein